MPIRDRQPAPTVIQDSLPLPPKLPDLPADLLERFPSLRSWQQDTSAWYRKLAGAIQDGNRSISQTTTQVKKTTDLLGVELIERFDELEDEVGNLFGKYTLQVVAGDVVTGMVLTSATGDTPISSVKFQADQFQIWNGSSGQAVFDLNGSDVTISGWTLGATTLEGGDAILDSDGTLILGTGDDVAILSASNATYRLWIGDATAGSAAFSVTKTGVMSATNGVFSGNITSTTGSIGGFSLDTNALEAGSGANRIGLFSFSSGPYILIGDDGMSPSTGRIELTDEASVAYCANGRSIGFYNDSTSARILGKNASGDIKTLINSEGVITLYNAIGSAKIQLDGSTGDIKFGTHAAIGGQTVTGYITISDSNGNARNLAVVS